FWVVVEFDRLYWIAQQKVILPRYFPRKSTIFCNLTQPDKTANRTTADQKVSGSNPLGRVSFLRFIAVISPYSKIVWNCRAVRKQILFSNVALKKKRQGR